MTKQSAYRMAKIIVAFMIVSTGECFSADWSRSWQEVKSESAARCAEIFPQYQLQAVCMQNEREGYEKMQRNFGMPDAVANKAKLRCAETFPQFQLQAVCMQNEKEGYEHMKQY